MTDLKNTQQQTKFKILLIGDSCLDVYQYGTIDRLSPEAPIPVIKLTRQQTRLGMARNVHSNLYKLGCDTTIISNSPSGLTGEPRITKTRIIDEKSGYQIVRIDEEPKIEPWDGIVDTEGYDAVVVSDYNKGFLTYEHIQNLIHDFNGPVFIDTKKRNLEAFNGAYVKINEKEFEEAESHAWDMIVTLGAKGAMLYCELANIYYETKKVDVVDVCGAGDTFLAALTYQYLVTNSIEEAIKFANKASSITVQHVGNYAPTLEEIK
jgi:D-beta-D-heptose 7-phosphate kinase/D-beta-D-heptose 1-phosphate adenosyltransferase